LAETLFQAARRLTLRLADPSAPVSALALEAIMIAESMGHPAREWLHLEVAGYPRTAQDTSEAVAEEARALFPKYRELHVYASRIFPDQPLAVDLAEAVRKWPDLFVPQFLYFPESLIDIEAKLRQTETGVNQVGVIWRRNIREPAIGPQDADSALYLQPAEFDRLLAGARRRIAEFVVDVISQARQTETSGAAAEPAAPDGFSYDVAISYAKPDRALADRLASIVREAGFAVFFDQFLPMELWGKDLAVFLDQVYREKSRYCVIFVSPEYAQRVWTNNELRSALSGALEDKGQEHILPIKVRSAELAGFRPTIGYLSLETHGIEGIAEILVQKLGAPGG